MAARVGVGLAGERRAALGLFSDVLARLGRYRAPGGGGARGGSGEEVGTVRLLERPGADGRRPPSFADYLALWEPLEREYRPSDREAVRFGHLRSAPEPFETMGGDTGVVGGVPGLAMAEIVLDQAQVVAPVGEIVATGMAQRVRVDVAETGAPGGGGDEIVHRLPGQGLASLGEEQPGQAIRCGRRGGA